MAWRAKKEQLRDDIPIILKEDLEQSEFPRMKWAAVSGNEIPVARGIQAFDRFIQHSAFLYQVFTLEAQHWLHRGEYKGYDSCSYPTESLVSSFAQR